MKTIGLIGGMSWESTSEYYRIINERIRELMGGLHSGKIVMYSFDFAEIEQLQTSGRWSDAAGALIDAALLLGRAGADFIVICTNTMHKVADAVQNAVPIPVIHIADAVAERIKELEVNKVGLLGTAFTMEEDFYRARLAVEHGIETIIPDEDDRTTVHRVIYDELCVGEIRLQSKLSFQAIIERLVSRGAGGIVLGCTEIPLLVAGLDVDVPLFDTTEIHAAKAAEMAVS
jgi:aspartate racemase